MWKLSIPQLSQLPLSSDSACSLAQPSLLKATTVYSIHTGCGRSPSATSTSVKHSPVFPQASSTVTVQGSTTRPIWTTARGRSRSRSRPGLRSATSQAAGSSTLCPATAASSTKRSGSGGSPRSGVLTQPLRQYRVGNRPGGRPVRARSGR